MLQGKYATKQSEARYPTLWSGLVAAFCPSVTGPTGLRLLNFGRGGDGTLTNMDMATDWPLSLGRHCLDFDGTDDYVTLGNASRPLLPSTTNWAVSGWVRLNDQGDNALFSQHISTGSNGRIMIRNSDSPTTVWEIFLGSDATGLGTVRVQSTSTASIGVWTHIVATRNLRTFTIYVNGVAEASTTELSTRQLLQNGNLIGAHTDNASTFNGTPIVPLNGQIDDLRIYNRALSAAEIALLARRRGIAFEPIPRHRRLISRIVDPQPTAATESTGFVFDRRLKLFKGQYAVTKQAAAFPNLWEGCVAAYAPCITGATGLKLFDFARGNTGTLTNMAAASDWPRSQGRYCLDFDTTNDYVTLGSSPHLDLVDSFSISFWMYPTLSGGTKTQAFIYKRNSLNNYPWGVVSETSNKVRLFSNAGSDASFTSSTSYTLNAWNHIVATRTGTSVAIYINGVQSGTGTLALGSSNPTADTIIGAQNFGTLGSYFSGNIDDIRIYNRVLQPSEVKTLSLSRGIAYRPRQKRIMPHYVTFPDETFTGPYIHVKRTKLLAGKFAVRKEDAKFPQLFEGRVGAWCPSIQGPCGAKLWDWARANTGATAANKWVRSDGRYALDFNGVSDGVQINGCLHGATSATYSAWFRIRSFTTNQQIVVETTSNSGYTRFGMLIITGASNYLGMVYRSVAADPTGSSTLVVSSTNALQLDTWYHGVITISGNLQQIYLNGTLIHSATNAFTSFATSKAAASWIGKFAAVSNAHDGQIDDIAIYNRVLTASEIRILSRSRGIAYTPKQKQYQPHNFAAVAATMSRLLMLRRKRALQCY